MDSIFLELSPPGVSPAVVGIEELSAGVLAVPVALGVLEVSFCCDFSAFVGAIVILAVPPPPPPPDGAACCCGAFGKEGAGVGLEAVPVVLGVVESTLKLLISVTEVSATPLVTSFTCSLDFSSSFLASFSVTFSVSVAFFTSPTVSLKISLELVGLSDTLSVALFV